MAIINNLITGNAIAHNVLTQLGYGGWALKPGKYNGCTFATFVKIPLFENNQIFQEGVNLIAAYNQITGSSLDGVDPNRIGQLYDTLLGALQFEDEYFPNVVVKDIPFSDRCNIEVVGSSGNEYKMVLLFLGADYQKALTNFINAIKNPPTGADYLILEHPTKGRIAGNVYVTSFKESTTLSNWNASTVNITFRAELSNVQQATNIGIVQQISNALLAALSGVLAINSASTALFSLLGNGVTTSSTTGAPITYTNVSNIQKNNEELATSLLNNTNYIYQNSNTGVVNNTLSSTSINYDYIPVSLNQNTSNYNTSQGNIIMEEYVEKCNQSISLIKSYSLGGIVNDMINTINQSISQLANVATLMAPLTSNLTYKVPYDMSIREILARNNIPSSQVMSILNLNPNLLSSNYILKDTVINL